MSEAAEAAPQEVAVPAKGSVKVKALPKPDKEAFDSQLAALQATQERHVARLAVLDAQIKERNAARKAGAGDKAGPRQQLQELSAAFKARVVRAELLAPDLVVCARRLASRGRTAWSSEALSLPRELLTDSSAYTAHCVPLLPLPAASRRRRAPCARR